MAQKSMVAEIEQEIVDAVKHVDFNKLTAFEAVAIGSVAVLSVMAGVAIAMMNVVA